MPVNQEFSIKDLETFTGIKAHTIRIWEQRYGILAPGRTDSNIRKYTDKDLKWLLNVSLLNSLGYKISRIAEMKDEEIVEIISAQTRTECPEKHYLHLLKISMINYDEQLFHDVTDQFIKDEGVEACIRKIILPFLQQVGQLWLADSICPAQEHFVSNLVRQKLFSEIEKLPVPPAKTGKLVVLYLPEHEIHELSLIMLHYLLRAEGRKSIYLGTVVPFDDLVQVSRRLGAVDFVSIFTTLTSSVILPDYIKKIASTFKDSDCHFYVTGLEISEIKSPDSSVISIFKNVDQLKAALS